MASNVIITFQTKADTTGAQQVNKSMDDMQKKMKETAESTKQMNASFRDLQSIVSGTILTLPLVGFIKEAIDSEQAMKRFDMSLKAFKQDVNGVDLESLTNKAHAFGITQTELVNALTRGLPYFHSVQRETQLMDTAMGMARFSGQSLADTFRTLGYVSEYGAGRAIRQFGISMHSDIHDPALRGAAILTDLTAKFGNLAGGARTTKEELATMGSTIKDIGEKVGAEFLAPIIEVAKAFNKLDDSMKETIVTAGLLVTTATGLKVAFGGVLSALAKLPGAAAFLSGLKFLLTTPLKSVGDLGAALKLLGGLFGKVFAGAAVPLTGLMAILATKNAADKAKASMDAVDKQQEINNKIADAAYKARAADASTSLGLEEKFKDKLEETRATFRSLAVQESFYKQSGNKNKEEAAKREKEQVRALLDGQEKETEYLTKHNIATLAQYKTFSQKMGELRAAGMSEGLDKDLTNLQLKMAKEEEVLRKAYGDEMDIRLALARKEATEETAIRKKEIDNELAYALMSKQEQAQYDSDYANAKSRLANLTIQSLKDASDATKKLLQTAGGKEALKQWENVEAKRQTLFHPLGGQNSATATSGQEQQWRLAQERVALSEKEFKDAQESGAYSEYALKNLKDRVDYQKELLAQMEEQVELEKEDSRIKDEKKLKFFDEEKKVNTTNIKLEPQVNINISPNPQEMAKEVADRLQLQYNMMINGIADEAKSHNVAASKS